MKTHEVFDLHYHPDEGQGCFDGTRQECEDFAAKQSPSFMYKVVPMTKEEIESHPDNKKMKRLTINNYQYWFNLTTGKLYADEAGIDEVDRRSLTYQESMQFYDQTKINR